MGKNKKYYKWADIKDKGSIGAPQPDIAYEDYAKMNWEEGPIAAEDFTKMFAELNKPWKIEPDKIICHPSVWQEIKESIDNVKTDGNTITGTINWPVEQITVKISLTREREFPDREFPDNDYKQRFADLIL